MVESRFSPRNRYLELVNFAEQVSNEAKSLPEVMAVVFLGGLARGYLDEYSDLDISVIVRDSNIEKERLRFNTVGKEIHSTYGIETDIEVHSFDNFKRQEWGDIERFSYKGCRVFFDRNGDVTRLIEEKLRVPDDFWTQRIVELSTYVSWYAYPEPPNISIAELWTRRGDVAQAHLCLNHATELVLDLIYALNHEFVPPAKWKLFYLRNLAWSPNGLRERIEESMRIGSYDPEDVGRRQRMLTAIWPEMIERIEIFEGLDSEAIKRLYVEEIVYRK